MAPATQQSRLDRPAAQVLVATAPLSVPRRIWSRPRLRHHGDLRGLTLGPSPGLGESSNPAIFRV